MSGTSSFLAPLTPRSERDEEDPGDHGPEEISGGVKEGPSSSSQASKSLTSEEEAAPDREFEGQQPKRMKSMACTTSAATVGEDSGVARRPRLPPYPTTGKVNDLRKWHKEYAKIREFLLKDPRNNLPTRREPKDPKTTAAVQNLKDKEVVLLAAKTIVSVRSITHDGKRLPPCTGIIMSAPSQLNGSIVVTCSKVVCKAGKKIDPLPKLSIGLPDKTVLDAEFMYSSDHYNIALLHVRLDCHMALPSAHHPEYGQEVFVLARDKDMSLRVRRGNIKCLEEADVLGRDYYTFLSCEIPEGGSGGMVIDHDGKVRGMAFHFSPYATVLSISTISICVRMVLQFGHIARPILGFGLRTVALLDVELQEEIYNAGIKTGFIVDVVYGSDAENHGIGQGNLILSINGQDDLTLPELEDYLLSIGWEYLINSSIQMNFKLQVYNMESGMTRDIKMAAKFCDAAERGSP